jgi:CBS domain-containing protein
MSDYLEENKPKASLSRVRLRCRDIMTRNLTVARRETTLQEIATMMNEADAGVIPIIEPAQDENANGQGKLVGLITDRDIVLRAVAKGKDITTTKAEEVMTTELHTAGPDERVFDIVRKMGDKQIRRVPVISDEGNLLGIISMADIALETEDDRELAEVLEEISSGTSFWKKTT